MIELQTTNEGVPLILLGKPKAIRLTELAQVMKMCQEWPQATGSVAPTPSRPERAFLQATLAPSNMAAPKKVLGPLTVAQEFMFKTSQKGTLKPLNQPAGRCS